MCPCKISSLGDLAWIEQRPLSAGAFAELLQGQCTVPKVVLATDSQAEGSQPESPILP